MVGVVVVNGGRAVPVPSTASNVVPLFSGSRLRLARETRAMTQTDLAKAVTARAADTGVGEGLSSAAVSQFEKGASRPNAARLASLAAVLDFPLGFFALGATVSSHPDNGTDELESSGHFRALRKVTAKERRAALAITQLVRDVTGELAQAVRLPAVDVPVLGVPTAAQGYFADAGRGWDDPIEAVAEQVRHIWGLAPGPVPDVLRLLESHGIATARHRIEHDSVHAFSAPFTERPVVVLGLEGSVRERDRFSAAHELGHLVMHRAQDALAPKTVEDQAHRFAAALLMPREDIAEQLPDKVDWRELQLLKQRWGTSMSSLVRRAWSLGSLSNFAYQHAMRTMSSRGWRVREPGDLGAPESPMLLAGAAAMAGGDAASLSAATGWPSAMIAKLLDASVDPRPQMIL